MRDPEINAKLQDLGARLIPTGGAPAVGYGFFTWLKEAWERLFPPREQYQLTPAQMLAQERRFSELKQLRQPYAAKENQLYQSWDWHLKQAQTWYETQRKNLQQQYATDVDRLKALYQRGYITREMYYSKLKERYRQYQKDLNSLAREYTMVKDRINRVHRKHIHNNRVEFGRKWYKRKAELEQRAR